MSLQLDAQLETTGTRFLLLPLPHYVDANVAPEEVVISIPPAMIKPGPADDRMFVVDAVNKLPYAPGFRPPYTGAANPPLKAGPDGHFTHLVPGTRAFSIATMYATVRRTLDIWEDYFGHRIPWHFETQFARMELIPLIEWDNAQSGFGFLEFGYGRKPMGGIDHTRPYCENFDVLCHETGHSIVFSQVGVPQNPSDLAIDYGGLHEASGDLVAIVSVLHFHTMVDRLLDHTRGNLFSVNELDRVGELSADRQIRLAFNDLRMSDVDNEPHNRSVPLTGGIFDILVEVFQKDLVKNNLISQDLATRSTQGPGHLQDLEDLQNEFDDAYQGNEAEFKAALLRARDYLGRLLAKMWGSLRPPNFLTYHDVLLALLRADRDPAVSGGEHQETIRSCFVWREIILPPMAFQMQARSLRECGLLPARLPASALMSEPIPAVVVKPNSGTQARKAKARSYRRAAKKKKR